MQEEPQNTGGPGEVDPEADAWEFKPVVKYAGVALGLLAVLGTEYAMYSVGYDRGAAEATPSASAQAQAELNAVAVANLTHFMQLSTASDEVLLDTVENYKDRLSWIEDEDVRREAEWTLAQALVDRGMVDKAQDMLAVLFPTVPVSPLWARRAICVAEALAAGGRTEEALSYYCFAASQYNELGMREEKLQMISVQAELLAASGADSPQAIASLEALQQEASQMGDAGLGANILVYIGTLHHQAGDSAKAMQCFEKALSGADLEKMPELASVAVCYGLALMEQGRTAEAERFLRDGVSRLGNDPADAVYLVAALRGLALLEQARDNDDEALGLLYRAEGVAMGRVPAGSRFWPMLYDQRGWLLFGKELYTAAYNDFTKAVKGKKHPELKDQPLEGAGRCCLALGKAEEAVAFFTEAIELRLNHTPDAKADIGRLYLLQGNAYDMASATKDAAGAYAKAVEYLPESSPDRTAAMMCCGYALTQNKQWDEAISVWEALQPLVSGDAALSQEVRTQLAACRQHRPVTPTVEETPAEQAPANNRARSSSSRSRRN